MVVPGSAQFLSEADEASLGLRSFLMFDEKADRLDNQDRAPTAQK